MTSPVSVPHKQVPVKINAFVDEGIRDLVETLNRVDERLWTWASCQGYEGEPAKVLMYYGSIQELDCCEMAKCAKGLGDLLKNNMGAGYATRLALEWDGDHAYPFISIEIPSSELSVVSRIFREQSASCRKNKHPLGRSEERCEDWAEYGCKTH